MKSFECHKSIRNYEKTIFGTSDAWSTSCLSHRPSEPAYYIIDCQISGFTFAQFSREPDDRSMRLDRVFIAATTDKPSFHQLCTAVHPAAGSSSSLMQCMPLVKYHQGFIIPFQVCLYNKCLR